MSSFSLHVDFNGQSQPFTFDSSATLGEVEAMVTNGCGVLVSPSTQYKLLLGSGEAISGLPSSLFLGLSASLRAELDEPASNRTARLQLVVSSSQSSTSNTSQINSIDEILAMTQKEIELPSGEDFLNSFDNLLGDMNKVISESSFTAPVQQTVAAPTTSAPSNASFLAEFDNLEAMQNNNKKKTLRSRDLNAFLEAEFADIPGISSSNTAAAPVTPPATTTEPVVPVVALPKLALAEPEESYEPPMGMNSPEGVPVMSVSERAEMAARLLKSPREQPQAINLTAVPMSPKDKKKDKKEKKPKEKKGKKKEDPRATLAEDFTSVANPTYESTDRAGVNPLFHNVEGVETQTSMERGGFVSPLASASTSAAKNAALEMKSGVPLSPRNASPRGLASPRPVQNTTNMANPPSPTTAQASQASQTTQTTSAPAAQPKGFTRAARPEGARTLRREHTIGQRQSAMLQPQATPSVAAVVDQPAQNNSAPVSIAPVEAQPVVQPTITPAQPTLSPEELLLKQGQDALLGQEKSLEEERLRIEKASNERYQQLLAQQKALEEQQAALLIAQQKAAEEQALAQKKAAEVLPDQQKPADEQAALIAQQKAAEEQAALVAAQQKVAEEQAALIAQQKLAEEQAALLAQQKAAEEQAALVAAQQKAVEEQAALVAAQQKAAEEQAALLAQQKAAEEQAALLAQQKAAEEQAALVAAQQKAAEEQAALLAQQKAAEEQAALVAAQQKAAEEQAALLAAQQKAAEEQAALLAQQKAAEEQAALVAAQQKAAEEQAALLAAQQKAAEEQAALLAQQKAAEEQAALVAAQQKAAEEQAALLAQQKAVEEQAALVAAQQKALEEQAALLAAQQKAAEEQAALLARQREEEQRQKALQDQQAAALAQQTVPTFVSQAPGRDYPDPTSISAMLHEQLDSLLLDGLSQPTAPITTIQAPAPAPASSTSTATPKDDPSFEDDMDQLLAELDAPLRASSSTETKHSPEPVPDQREPGEKPAEPPPVQSESSPSNPQSSGTTSSSSSTIMTAVEETPHQSPDSSTSSSKPSSKKKKKKKQNGQSAGTFSSIISKEKERRKSMALALAEPGDSNPVSNEAHSSDSSSSSSDEAPTERRRRRRRKTGNSSSSPNASTSKLSPKSSSSSINAARSRVTTTNESTSAASSTTSSSGIRSTPSSQKLPRSTESDGKRSTVTGSPAAAINNPKKKFKRARKRDFDEEIEYRRRLDYNEEETAETETELEPLETGCPWKTVRPSSMFRFAEDDNLMYLHLGLQRMSMMRQAPFWLKQPQELASERFSFKIANAASYPYGKVDSTASMTPTLNVMFHLGEHTKYRVLLLCSPNDSIQHLKELAYNQLEQQLASLNQTNLLKIIDEYVVQLTDTPIFINEESTTLEQLLISASWMHVEQFTLVERSQYELTKLKATSIAKMISATSSPSTESERVATVSSSGNFILSTPLYSPSDTEEMHFRKNVSRNTIVLIKKNIQVAAVTSAPIPPYIPSKIFVTVYHEPGSSTTILVGPNSTVLDLIDDSKKKFFIHISSHYVLKICGRREYIVHTNTLIHRLEYVRKALERRRKIQLQLIKASSIGVEYNEQTGVLELPWERTCLADSQSQPIDHPLSPRNFKPDNQLSSSGTKSHKRVNLNNQAMSIGSFNSMLASSDATNVEKPRERAKRLRLSHRRASLYYSSTKALSIPSWLVKQAFEVKVVSAEALIFGENTKNLNFGLLSFFVEVGLYFGGEPLVQPKQTAGIPYDDVLVWDQVIVFQSICLGGIPKETRICFTLYAREKSSDIPLGWVSCRLFDFHDVVVGGQHTTFMWPEEAANPIGFCGSCSQTKEKNIHRLNLEFESYPVPVTYTDIMSIPSRGRERKKHPRPSKSSEAEIEKITKMDSLWFPSNRERELCWKYRHYIRETFPKALNKVVLSVPWTDPLQIREFYLLLEKWPKLEPEDAMELLDARYANERVREFAVVCLEALTDHKLVSFLLQLVQVLKYEINHYNVLAQFLLDRALENEMIIGQRFFWYLKAEIHVPENKERFALLLEALLTQCSEQLLEQLQQQTFVVGILQDCALRVKTFPEARRTDAIRKMLCEIKFPAAFTLPLDPTQELSGNLDVSKCRCFDSAKAPILLCFRSADPCIEKDHENLIIFKAGDDLRQDALTLQMLTLMDSMWKHAGLDLHMTPYQVAVTGDGTGLIEVVPDSNTTAKIQRENGGSLAAFSEKPLMSWLKLNNPTDAELSAAVDNFVLSCAGYCVATYVLGVGDRHNDNIMVDRKGHFFHIDFGHFLGNYKSWAGIWDREKAPFVFTSEFAFVMDGKDSDKFNYFVRQCQRAYNIVRQHGNFILNLFTMMLSTGIPELRSAADLLYLRDALAQQLTDAEAGDLFQELINSSLDSKTTRLNAFFHLLAH